jgi:hypothetical protein
MAGKPAPSKKSSSTSKKATFNEKTSKLIGKPKKKRPGIVSKNNTSNIKNSRNYIKAYRGQGR